MDIKKLNDQIHDIKMTKDDSMCDFSKYDHLKDGTCPFTVLLAELELFTDYSRVILRHFPKHERHLLHDDIRKNINTISKNIIVAWKRYHKKTTLIELDIEIEILRMNIRTASRANYISNKSYMEWIRRTVKLGSMVGGWLKHVICNEK